HRDAGDQVQVLVAVGVPDAAPRAAGESQRRRAVVRHHDRLEPFAQRFALAHRVPPKLGPGASGCSSAVGGWTGASETTIVPIPESGKISSGTAGWRRRSRRGPGGTPPRPAVRQASIFGIMPADRVGSSRSRSLAPSWLMTSAEAGQSRYNPATSVSTISLAAPNATASAAAAVSAFTL